MTKIGPNGGPDPTGQKAVKQAKIESFNTKLEELKKEALRINPNSADGQKLLVKNSLNIQITQAEIDSLKPKSNNPKNIKIF